MTNILVVSHVYWPEGSGGTLATHLIVELLSRVRDLQITVLTGTSTPEKIDRANVRYIIDPFLKKIVRLYSFPNLVMKRYSNLIEKNDVVYIVYAFAFTPVAKKLNKRAIVHLHDYKPISPSAKIPFTCSENPTLGKLLMESFRTKYFEYKSIRRTLLNVGECFRIPPFIKWTQMADTVIAVSKRHAELLMEVVPEIGYKLKVIYNPPPPIPSISKKPEPEPTFLYVGGESYLKGFYTLLDSIRRFLEKGGKAKFIFTNRFSKTGISQINKINKRRGGTIQLVGKIDYYELLKLYSKAWALIFPSIWEEPLPYAVLEALATKTVPIASRIGGIPELLSSTPAERFLFQPGDSVVLSENIFSLSAMSLGEIVEVQENTIASIYQHLKHTKLNENRILRDLLKVIYGD